MFFKSNEQKKMDKLERTIIDIIDDFEYNLSDLNVSCKNVLLKDIRPFLKNRVSEAVEWDDNFDYVNTAYCVIYQTSFNLLASGKFHIFRGVLNEMNESRHLYKFCLHHLNRAVELNLLSEEEKLDQIAYLNECIRDIG